ncbi:MAG: hypothetical protein ACOC1L_03585 [Bacillota bacterium]
MQPFTFDNQMKSTGINFIKAGAAFSALIFVVSLLLYAFTILDLLSVIIITGLFFLLFYVIGIIFIIQQKHITFNDAAIEIYFYVKKSSVIIDVDDIEHVTIIKGNNIQPKIIIKYSEMHHTITCANTVTNQALESVKAYFETRQISTVIKNKGIR